MKIVIVGLGYVGLPLAIAVAKHFHCWGLDIDHNRIEQLRTCYDRTGEIDPARLSETSLRLTVDPADCTEADAIIVTVPTPIDAERRPDLGPIVRATEMLARLIDPTRCPVIIYESTVYPGVTEDICGPLIEKVGGHARGRDFLLGYSPERINPGDREHTIDRIVKVVSGDSPQATDRVAAIYEKVTSAGVFRAASIKAAEAAKIIENAQRDINIALMNEVTQIFSSLNLSIWDVIDAARTKWNFLPFQPGLVGGHCIGVDPYYLSHLAQSLGHDPQVILSGRAINDGMGAWIADRISAEHGAPAGTALILGLTFKEDVPDLRNSKVIDVVRRLQAHGFEVTVHDPMADPEEAWHEYGVVIEPAALDRSYDIVVGAVPHQFYRNFTLRQLQSLLNSHGLLADIKQVWSNTLKGACGSRLWSL